MNIIDSLRNKFLIKPAAPSSIVGAIKPPLIRHVDDKAISLTMYCQKGDYSANMAWFRPKAKLKDTVFGYKLKNDPTKNQVIFESIGKESDDFLKQVAAVSNITLRANTQMAKSAAFSVQNISTEDDMEMLQTVYGVRLGKANIQIILNIEDWFVTLSLRENDAKAFIKALSTA
jgi:hypothetical protein